MSAIHSESTKNWSSLRLIDYSVPSAVDPEFMLITPGVPSKSAVFLRTLREFPMRGSAMPPNDMNRLTQDEQWLIERWILSL